MLILTFLHWLEFGIDFFRAMDRFFRTCGEALEETTASAWILPEIRESTWGVQLISIVTEKDGLGNSTSIKPQRDTHFPKEVASYHLVDQEIRQVSFKPDLLKEQWSTHDIYWECM